MIQMSTDCFELKHDYELFDDDDDKQEIMRYQEDSEAGLDANYISDQKNLDGLEDDNRFCWADDDEIENNESRFSSVQI